MISNQVPVKGSFWSFTESYNIYVFVNFGGPSTWECRLTGKRKKEIEITLLESSTSPHRSLSVIMSPLRSYLHDFVDLEVLEWWIQRHPEEKTQAAVSRWPRMETRQSDKPPKSIILILPQRHPFPHNSINPLSYNIFYTRTQLNALLWCQTHEDSNDSGS